MFKRIRWMIFGAFAAFLAYNWVTRRAKAAVPKAASDVVAQASANLRDLGERIVEALREGREAMLEREEELRRELLGGNGHGG